MANPMGIYEMFFADHLLSSMNLSLDKREFVGKLLMLPNENPDEVEKTEIKYGKINETLLGNITHASRAPLVISSKTILRGRFAQLEKDSRTIKKELSDFLQEKGIWIPNAEIIQYSAFSYFFESEKMDEFYHSVHFSVKRD